MIKKGVVIVSFVFVCFALHAQKSKVQTAWRGLSDFEETLKDGKPELSYLTKAKEAVDAALEHPDTKNQTKAHAYKLRISYALFQYNLTEEIKKLEPTIKDKNERILVAYGKISLVDFEVAIKELNTIRDLDPKFLQSIQEGLLNGAANLDDDELKFALAAQQMKIESANIASGKYKNQNYAEAADFFYRTAVMNTILFKTMDTASFYNACVAASKAKDKERILDYNKSMIDAKISQPYNYESLLNVNLASGDTAAALETVKKGRLIFPNDVGLLTQETNIFLSTGRQQEALKNLNLSIEKDPNNALYYFLVGNIYDNMANPPQNATNADLQKPTNFEELFSNAEKNYLKAISLNPSNKDHLYNSLFNLGAMYNNYGGNIANAKTSAKGSEAAKQQKDNEQKAQAYYFKAIPYLEKALALKSDDSTAMAALRKLYMITGNEAKAKEMGDRMK